MGLLIDTSVFVALERRGASFEGLGTEPVHLAAVTASELLHGVYRATTEQRRARREAWVERILSLVPVIPFDLSVARVHARVWADLAASGTPIGAHDTQIAATALACSLRVLTANVRDFGRVEGLAVEPWARSSA